MTDTLRGHPIYHDGINWRYRDDDSPTAIYPRDCGKCHEPNTPEGHDPCLGTIPGAMNACCGHGETAEAYVQLRGGRRLAGQEALDYAEAPGPR